MNGLRKRYLIAPKRLANGGSVNYGVQSIITRHAGCPTNQQLSDSETTPQARRIAVNTFRIGYPRALGEIVDAVCHRGVGLWLWLPQRAVPCDGIATGLADALAHHSPLSRVISGLRSGAGSNAQCNQHNNTDPDNHQRNWIATFVPST
jgi:hypothetical protein